jgi:hypothetical protein
MPVRMSALGASAKAAPAPKLNRLARRPARNSVELKRGMAAFLK